jgi:hypothetical protein
VCREPMKFHGNIPPTAQAAKRQVNQTGYVLASALHSG